MTNQTKKPRKNFSEELRERLKNRNTSGLSTEPNPQAQSGEKKETSQTSIQESFRLGAVVTKTSSRLLNSRVKSIQEISQTKDWSAKDWNKAADALNLLAILTGTGELPNKENWESATDYETLVNIREEISKKALSRLEARFSRCTPTQCENLEKSLRALRLTSKPLEVEICIKEAIPPVQAPRSAQGPWRAGEIPPFIEELANTLAQIAVFHSKKTDQVLEEKDTKSFREMRAGILLGRRAPKNSKALAAKKALQANPDWLTNQIQGFNEDSLTQAMGDQIAELLEKAFSSEEAMAIIIQEKEKFESEVKEIGTELEGIDDLQKAEFAALSSLEQAYDTLMACQVTQDSQDPEQKKIKLFQEITSLSPTMGKATALSITTKLNQDPVFLADYDARGAQAILAQNIFRTHISITEPEDSIYSEASEPDTYVETAAEIQQVINLLAISDQALYSDPVISALAHKDRQGIIESAQRVFSDENRNTTMDKTMIRIRENTSQMIAALNKEIEGEEKNLEFLPIALKETASQMKTARALTRSTELCIKAQVTIENMLEETQDNVDTLRQSLNAYREQSPDETEEIEELEKELRTANRKLQTLVTFAQYGKTIEESRDRTFNSLSLTLEVRQVPKTEREHALISICDGKREDGTELLVLETAQEIEKIAEMPGFSNAMRSDILSLRKWKNRETEPKTPNGRALAQTICRTPENLRKTLRKDLSKALLACCDAKPWRTPLAIPNDELKKFYTSYITNKPELEELSQTNPKSKDILNALKALYQKTKEILERSPNSWIRTEELAKELENKGPDSLEALRENLAEATLTGTDTKAQEIGIEFLTDWHQAIGNFHSISRESMTVKPTQRRDHELEGSLLANRIQIKISNLIEIKDYFMAVTASPEALAETYLQHRISTSRIKKADDINSKENWEKRISKEIAKVETKVVEKDKEIESLSNRFLAYFEVSSDENAEISETNFQNSERVDREACRRLLRQKDRELETFLGEKARLRQMLQTTSSLNQAQTGEEFANILEKDEEEIKFENNIGMALAAASFTAKAQLPKKIEEKEIITPFQMLEGAAIFKRLENVSDILEEGKKILARHNPEAQDIVISTDDLHKSSRDLAKVCFDTIKEVENLLWEKGKISPSDSLKYEEQFVYENPELAEARHKWIARRQTTLSDIVPTLEIAKELPRKGRTQPKDEIDKKTEKEVEGMSV